MEAAQTRITDLEKDELKNADVLRLLQDDSKQKDELIAETQEKAKQLAMAAKDNKDNDQRLKDMEYKLKALSELNNNQKKVSADDFRLRPPNAVSKFFNTAGAQRYIHNSELKDKLKKQEQTEKQAKVLLGVSSPKHERSFLLLKTTQNLKSSELML